MTIIGTKMVSDGKTARQIFEEVMANPARTKFGFGEKLAIVNVDFQNAYTRIDEFKTAYETDPKQIDYTNQISDLARAKGMPVIWTHVAYAADASDAGVWGTRTNTPDSLQNIKYDSHRHAFDDRCRIDPSDMIYTKRMPSAFFETPLQSLLIWHKVDTVVITGGSTSGCIRATAVDSLSRGYRTIVPIETCADKHESYHFANLTDLQLKYADVEPVQTVIDWLEAPLMQEGAADPGLYDFTPYRNRKPIAWPGDKKVAVWISPNLEYYEIDPPTNPHRKSWAKPHPDVVGYSHRDHANRISHWRMAELMSKYGFPGSVSLSVALCQHHPDVVADANARGWEFFSHGIYNTRYSYGMDEAQERAIIEDSIRTVREATGQTIKGWLAPALTHTPRTLDLIADYGLSYTCDLYHDDQPMPVKTRSGQLISMPYSLEVNDHYGFFIYNMSPRDYAQTLIRQYNRLANEGSGTVMCIPLHSYLIGQPHRIGAFEEVLRHIVADGRAWITRSGDIADHWLGLQHD